MKIFQIAIALSFVILYSCNQKPLRSPADEGFVYLEGKDFMLNGEKFFPLTLNYIAQMRAVGDEIVAGATKEYDSLHVYEASTKEEIHHQVRGHFQLIKEMGFNSIRLVLLNQLKYDPNTGKVSLRVYEKDGSETAISFEENKDKYLAAVSEFLDISEEIGLHIMIILERPAEIEINDNQRINFITEVLKTFSERNIIFAYDFFNEPLYFDNVNNVPEEMARTKSSAFELVQSWRDLMDQFAPMQLFTIGFSEPTEVFEWDPQILPVDFVAFHTYNPLRVPNEIYWYSKYIDKPWMIGETSLPANNDSISYLEQAQFMEEILKRVINCGGSGFGWWQFQDVEWGHYEHNYTPLLNHEGITKTKEGDYTIYGTVKPAVEAMNNFFENHSPTDDCPCHVNYYNMVAYKNYLIEGKVIHQKTKKGIDGAVVRGWTRSWIGAHTFTKPDGSFTLFSNDEFVHFEISAPGMTKEKFYMIPEYEIADENISLDSLELKDLEQQNISYRPMLVEYENLSDSATFEKEDVIFHFREELFNQYKLKATMEPVVLRPFVYKKEERLPRE